MKYYEKLYYYGKYTLYALYIVAYLGLWDKAPKYLDDFDYYLKILIALLLMYFFNPFHKIQHFEKFHRDVAFSAGFFLLATTALTSIKNAVYSVAHTITNV